MAPTIKSAALSGTAFMSDCISMTSTMEVSSTTSRSQSSGLSSPRLKPPPLGSTSEPRVERDGLTRPVSARNYCSAGNTASLRFGPMLREAVIWIERWTT